MHTECIKMVYARVSLDDYTNRVLNVIKGKYGLKDKSEAINKMADLYGDELVDKLEVRPEYMDELNKIYEEHMRLHPGRRMTLAELDAL